MVVGGGVFGITAALELRSRRWQVTVLDPGPLPHEGASSTDVSKVVRMDYGSDRFYHELAELALEGWDRWNRDWSRPLYHEDGFLILAPAPMAPGGYEYESYTVLRARGYTPERLDARSDSGRYPEWNLTRYPDGYLNARAGWAESGAVVEQLLSLCRKSGVSFRAGSLRELISRGSRVRGVVTSDADRIEADRVVVAAGGPGHLACCRGSRTCSGPRVIPFSTSSRTIRIRSAVTVSPHGPRTSRAAGGTDSPRSPTAG